MAYQRRVVQSIQLLRSYTKLTAVLENISMILFSSVLFYELEHENEQTMSLTNMFWSICFRAKEN